MPLSPGTRLGPYEILAPLGAGGMGEVYRAHDPRLGRDVALKILPDDVAPDESARQRLIREARVAAQLNHPHICTIYEAGEADERAYIAMEAIDGRALDRLIEADGLPAETAIRYGIQLADALDAAHARGVVHRDLKCANVVITSDGRVKVLDFGLARRLGAVAGDSERTRTVTASQTLVGTPRYLAPEVLRGAEADARSDLWALGIVLYEMASGRGPFHGASMIELGAAILHEPPAPLPRHVPRGLAAIIERCLAKDPARRYRSAGEARAALEGVEVRADEASGVRPSTIARRPASRWVWAVATLILIAAGVALVAGLRTRRGSGQRAGRILAIAVLPLDDFSRDPAQQFFADGMTDELITTLAQISTLRVTSRTSVMGFRGTVLPVREIARRLGVDAVVEGSVQRAGDRVRITAQLIRAATDEHLWAQSYERDLRDVLALQDEVAGAIAQEVKARTAVRTVSAAAGGHAAQHGTSRSVSPRAYELYLRGFEAYRRWQKPSDRTAAQYLRQAIAIDSTYAPSWAALGLVYIDEPGQFGTRADDVGQARRFIDRALALDPDLGLAHEAKGEIAFRQDWNWALADRELRRAIELSPNLFEAHHMLSHLMMALGRERDSFREAGAALALDPLNTDATLHMGWVYLATGQLERAVRQFRATLQLDPGFSEAYRFLATTNVLLGRYDDAVAAQNRAFDLSGIVDSTSRVISLRSRLALHAVIAARRGDRADALRMAQHMAEEIDAGRQTAYDLASVDAQLGRKDEAFHWLDRSLALHEKYLPGLRYDGFFVSLRGDPRFAALLRRIGLPV